MTIADEKNARCLVLTKKEGLLSAAAHDLKIEVTRFSIDQTAVDSVAARFDARSLRVVAAMRDGEEDSTLLSARDRAKIDETIARDVLQADKYPEIRLDARYVDGVGKERRLNGELLLHGATRPLSCVVIDGQRCEVELDQRDFGIVPYTAMFGTLRVQALVRIVVELR